MCLLVICVDAKKGGEDAADRAEELLREMEDSYNNGDLDLRPNIKTYCAVISKCVYITIISALNSRQYSSHNYLSKI